MIQLKKIVRTYTTRKGVQTKALKGLNLDLPDKGLIFILGKSGSGKSTLLNILGGLDKADEGEFLINGKNIEGFNQLELDYYRNAHVGLALALQGRKVDKKKVDGILDFFGLSGLGKRKGNEVSGGQKQRIAVARALVKNPTIVLVDEPTGNLDLKTSRQIMELLKKVSIENLVVVVSHDPEEAELYGDRIIRIKDGLIFEDKGIIDPSKSEREFVLNHPRLSFISSISYGVHALFKKKGQLLITNFRKKQIGILRSISNYISNVKRIFRFEAIFVGFIVMVLVYFLVPVFVDILNFAFMVHFQDTFISYYHYQIYTVGIGSIVEIFLLLSLLITMLTFTLTHNINLIDPVDVISGR